MKYSSWIMGNSSSGIIEASIMNVKCLNVGDRQKGIESFQIKLLQLRIHIRY